MLAKQEYRRVIKFSKAACRCNGSRLPAKEGSKYSVFRTIILVRGVPECVALFEVAVGTTNVITVKNPIAIG